MVSIVIIRGYRRVEGSGRVTMRGGGGGVKGRGYALKRKVTDYFFNYINLDSHNLTCLSLHHVYVSVPRAAFLYNVLNILYR